MAALWEGTHSKWGAAVWNLAATCWADGGGAHLTTADKKAKVVESIIPPALGILLGCPPEATTQDLLTRWTRIPSYNGILSLLPSAYPVGRRKISLKKYYIFTKSQHT